jgi:TPR repeat protein
MHRAFLPTLLSSVLLSSTLTTQAWGQQAQDPPSLWSLFTVERLGAAVFSQVILSARAFADVRYQGVQTDLLGGQLGIVGLEVMPALPGVPAGACVMSADRATLRGAPFDQRDEIRVRVTLDNALLDFDCLPLQARPMVGMLGITDIAVDRLDLTLSYDLPRGGAQIQFEAGIEGLVRLIGDVDLDYVSYRMDPGTGNPAPAAQLRRARVQVEDLGLAAQAERLLPPQLRAPGAAQAMVEGTFGQVLGQGGGLNDAQRQLVTDAGVMATHLVQGGTRVVLETTIENAPVRVDEALLADPAALITALSPRLSAAPSALRSQVAHEMLVAATQGTLAPQDRLTVGRALITGKGAPRDRDLAAEILFPLVQEGDAEAALLLAIAFEHSNPDLAYRDAVRAVATGRADGLALLDRLEDRLSFDMVMEIQSIAAPARLSDPARFNSLAQMRSAALAHMTGLSAPRSFETAYYWAAMAAAGGDSAAAALRDELDERMRLRGLSGPWAARTRAIERAVLSDWIDTDMGNRLQQN